MTLPSERTGRSRPGSEPGSRSPSWRTPRSAAAAAAAAAVTTVYPETASRCHDCAVPSAHCDTSEGEGAVGSGGKKVRGGEEKKEKQFLVASGLSVCLSCAATFPVPLGSPAATRAAPRGYSPAAQRTDAGKGAACSGIRECMSAAGGRLRATNGATTSQSAAPRPLPVLFSSSFFSPAPCFFRPRARVWYAGASVTAAARVARGKGRATATAY